MNKKIFWSFQLSYWSIYFFYNIFVVHYTTLMKEETNPAILVSYLFLLCFFGIPLSLIAKRIITGGRLESLSLIKILTGVFLISILLGNVWVLEIIFLDKFYDKVLDLFSITRYKIIPMKWRVYFWELFVATLLLIAWIGIYLSLKFWNQWQKQQFEIEKANLQLELAQLKMLRSQISPHFLFNALSSLRALIRNDAKKAEEMLSKISEFLRYSLVNKINVEVPFSEELLAIRNYFSIEKVRFGDKLQIDYDIDPPANDFPVPGFILHPIIENSVKYGMESSTLPLRINITARIEHNRLYVEVMNSGKWHDRRENQHGTGTGLSNVQNRLQTLYPGRHNFHFIEADGHVKISLEIERDPNEEFNQGL